MTQEAPTAVSAIPQQKDQRFPALSNPAFRLFWLSMFASFLGNQMQLVTQGWLVLELTNSPFFLGLMAAASGLPIFLISPFGGAVADRLERRKLIVICQLITSCLMISIALLVLTGRVAVWQVAIVAVCLGTVMAFNDPARQAFITELVKKEHLLNAISLNTSAMNITRIGGPMIAGVIIAALGIGFSYVANTLLSLIAAVTMVSIPKSKVSVETTKTTVWSNVKDGLSYVRGNETILWLLIAAAVPTVPGATFVALLPIFARDVLDVGAAGLGQLMGAAGVGALVGSLGVASMRNLKHKGFIFVASGGFHCFTSVIFALTTWYPLSLALMALGGVGQAVWIATITTLLQTHAPNELRGRVMSLFLMTMQTVLLSQLLGGVLASLIGASYAIAVGCSLGVITSILMLVITPVVRRLD